MITDLRKPTQKKSRLSRKKEFYVYALLDPRKPGPFYYGHWKFSHEPFYIGKGKKDRIKAHNYDSRNTLKSNIFKRVESEGLQVIRCVKRGNLSEKAAFSLEIKLIALIGRRALKAGPLANSTEGGEGISGHLHTKETKVAIGRLSNKMHSNMSDLESLSRGKKISETKLNKTAKEKKDFSSKMSKIAIERNSKFSESKRKQMSSRLSIAQKTRLANRTDEEKEATRIKRSNSLKLAHSKRSKKDKLALKQKLSAAAKLRCENMTKKERKLLLLRVSEMGKKGAKARWS